MIIEIIEKDGRWYFADHKPAGIREFITHEINVPDDATIQITRRIPTLCLPSQAWQRDNIGFPAAAVWLAAKHGTINGIHPAAATD